MLSKENTKPSGKSGSTTPKLRTACENCRQSKVKCNLTGKDICSRCICHGLQCRYGFANRSGKPKGSKNRATLKKIGRLQEGKRSMARIIGEGNCELFAVKPKHVVIEQHDDQMGLCQGNNAQEKPKSIPSQSPSNSTVDTPVISNTPTPDTSVVPNGFDDQVLGELLDFDFTCQLSSIETGYPQASPSLDLLPSVPIPKGMTNYPPLSLHFPYVAQPPCECFSTQVSHVDQLSRMVSDDPVDLRLDECLQNIKSAFSSCQAFLQCSSCHKDCTSLLPSFSVIDSALQIFDHWIDCKQPRDIDIRYGRYEINQDENRIIRNFLIRNLLDRSKEILIMLRSMVDTCVDHPRNKTTPVGWEPDALGFPPSFYDETMIRGPVDDSTWSSLSEKAHLCLGDYDNNNNNNNSNDGGHDEEDNCFDDNNTSSLRRMVMRYDNTVDDLLRSIPSSNFICDFRMEA